MSNILRNKDHPDYFQIVRRKCAALNEAFGCMETSRKQLDLIQRMLMNLEAGGGIDPGQATSEIHKFRESTNKMLVSILEAYSYVEELNKPYNPLKEENNEN